MPKDTSLTASASSGWMDRRKPPHIGTLIAASGLSALNMNMIVPALPGVAKHFDADYAIVALTLSLYLALTGLVQLFIGPLSDRFGRRPVILWAFSIFLIATLGCTFAPTIQVFVVCRMLQATVTAGFVLSRAIVRDTVATDLAASQIGYITVGVALVPMLSPMLGSSLAECFGWRSIMLVTALVGAAALALAWADLGETNRAPSASLVHQLQSYPELVRSRRFWGYALTVMLASGAFYAFLGAGPWVATTVFGMGPSAIGYCFGSLAFGYLIGNLISGRFAPKVGIDRMMLLGGTVATLGIAVELGLMAVGRGQKTGLFGTLGLLGMGNGLLLPSANAGIVSVKLRLAGSASGLAGALTVGGGACASALAGATLKPEYGAWPLVWLMFVCSLAGIFTTVYVIGRKDARAGRVLVT